MAGSVKLLDTASALSSTTTRGLTGTAEGHGAATFYFDATTVTGTWTVAVKIVSHDDNAVTVALSASITTTGMKELVNQSPFTLTNRSVPGPNQVVYTESVAGGLTGKLYAVYGD